MKLERSQPMDEYEKLVNRMNTPRVVIDNAVCPNATLVKVDSAQKRRVLLETVQVLTDLNLSIHTAYISSDGCWFMDVFHVTDLLGNKITDHSLQSSIEEALGGCSEKTKEDEGLAALELTGTDRPGILSEVFAVLADLGCSVAEAKVWTHNCRIACIISLRDDGSLNSYKIKRVESRLQNVLSGDCSDLHGARVAVAASSVCPDRRLHQMMSADRDYERISTSDSASAAATVSVQDLPERGYSVLTIQSRNRPKLLFDVVCTLTDMEYVVYHGKVDTCDDQAHQEFYIKHADGSPISSDAERQRVVQCLQAAVGRRADKGLRLEQVTEDRRRQLSEVTRTLRENGLSVTHAEVSTKGCTASNMFIVTDPYGRPVEPKMIDAIRQRAGMESLRVVEESPVILRRNKSGEAESPEAEGGAGIFYLGSLVKRNLYNLGLIRSCS